MRSHTRSWARSWAHGTEGAIVLGVIRVERTSELDADAERVWAHATSMAGVNAELRPWLRMTTPTTEILLMRVSCISFS